MMNNGWKDKVILIAEDEKINFLFLKSVFKEKGAEILWAKNGNETIQICREHGKIDLVLMDIQMPGVDGLQATQLIKYEQPNLPILAQTAYSTNDDRSKALSAGCDDFLAKPIHPLNLMATIERYLFQE
ncbi:MAG: response regulator [Bacteroidales bacterium]